MHTQRISASTQVQTRIDSDTLAEWLRRGPAKPIRFPCGLESHRCPFVFDDDPIPILEKTQHTYCYCNGITRDFHAFERGSIPRVCLFISVQPTRQAKVDDKNQIHPPWKRPWQDSNLQALVKRALRGPTRRPTPYPLGHRVMTTEVFVQRFFSKKCIACLISGSKVSSRQFGRVV